MIRNFLDPESAIIWRGDRSRRLPSDIQQVARRKLRQLDAALVLDELRSPTGNRLEKLKGSGPVRYSIRINDQWRITFAWVDGDAFDVRIEDYHRG